ncbi:hypothetical protein [Microbacterium deminutum]|uniref:DUF998 domain-containing protein n=1 Tax=Microbacterium deminutum TaxID=344164 RepID=A0ABN2RLH2_9MICO
MIAEARRSFADRTRWWRLALAVAGGVWAAVTMPLVATAFGSPMYVWVFHFPTYVWAYRWADDPYITFGAFAGLSFLAIGLALLPDLGRAGWGGTVMAWLLIAGAPVCVLSYLSSPSSAPLHFLWGWEGILLFLACGFGVAAAATAGPRWGIGLRTLLGFTFLIVVVGTIALSYWPHASLVVLAAEAVAIIIAAPRDPAFQDEPAFAGGTPVPTDGSPL